MDLWINFMEMFVSHSWSLAQKKLTQILAFHAEALYGILWFE